MSGPTVALNMYNRSYSRSKKIGKVLPFCHRVFPQGAISTQLSTSTHATPSWEGGESFEARRMKRQTPPPKRTPPFSLRKRHLLPPQIDSSKLSLPTPKLHRGESRSVDSNSDWEKGLRVHGSCPPRFCSERICFGCDVE